MTSPKPVFGMCMNVGCLSMCYSFSPRSFDIHTCDHCLCKNFNHLVDGYIYDDSFIPTKNSFQHQYVHSVPATVIKGETERTYSMSSTRLNGNSGYVGSYSSSSVVSTPYTGDSVAKCYNPSSSGQFNSYPNVTKNNIERGLRDDSTHGKRSRKYSAIKEKHVTIILLASRRLSKHHHLPITTVDFALYKKNNQIIEDYTLSTVESFDNLLGSNTFASDWTSYFFYDRCGKMSLTTSGYCFQNWPTSDILSAFNQTKELFVTECCFVEELPLFGLTSDFNHCAIDKVAVHSSAFLASDAEDDVVID